MDPRFSDKLLLAQLNELSIRERLSATVALPAMMLVGWAHWGDVEPLKVGGWLILLGLVQLWRLVLTRVRLDGDGAGTSAANSAITATSSLNMRRHLWLRILANAVTGFGWGATWLLFDNGQLDFLFMFRFGVVAGALGVAVNGLNVVLRVYAAFIVAAAAAMTVFLLADASYLLVQQRLWMLASVVVYVVLLTAMARSANRIARLAFEQSFEREAALDEARQSHQRELALRERLQNESMLLEASNDQLQTANRRLQVLSRQDELTGLYNRRHLMEELERSVHMLTRYRTDFSVISLDIDHFKAINDTYGHQTGDLVLKGLAAALAGCLRDIDVFGRWGGEEFLCVLPQAAQAEALACAERLRRHLAEQRLVAGVPDLVVTASFGVATCTAGEDVDALLGRVDGALYAAKKGGRNRVVGA
ncbi:MAG: GGDEF domain-containing protein [Propionivibrio sp.]